jgi:predicted RNA polymerase sigma factor
VPADADLCALRLGRDEEAVAAYGRARDLVANPVERALLERRLAEFGA